MEIVRLLDFSLDQITPHIGKTSQIVYQEDQEALENNPEQIHLEATGSYGKIYLTLRKQTTEDQIITILGANYDATPVFNIHVNGDPAWKTEFENAFKALTSDPYLCTPQDEN